MSTKWHSAEHQPAVFSLAVLKQCGSIVAVADVSRLTASLDCAIPTLQNIDEKDFAFVTPDNAYQLTSLTSMDIPLRNCVEKPVWLFETFGKLGQARDLTQWLCNGYGRVLYRMGGVTHL